MYFIGQCYVIVNVRASADEYYRIAGKIGGLIPNDVFNTIRGLKFGGMVQYNGGLNTYRQTAKFNSLPNFPAIRYVGRTPSYHMNTID